MTLSWLPEAKAWPETLAAIRASEGAATWDALRAAAGLRLDIGRTNQLDRLLLERLGTLPSDASLRPVRLAILSSSTVGHLLPAIRVGALRRGLRVEIYTAPYGAYSQDLLDPSSGLCAFGPDEILFAFDTPHLAGQAEAAAGTAREALTPTLARVRDLWRQARETFRCPVIQQTLLPVEPPLLGSAEHRYAGSRAHAVMWLNGAMREAAVEDGVDIQALDALGCRYGLDALHDPVWWLRAKQEVAPAAAPLYGEHLARILAARRGLSRKCLVLDLDNTLWGGVVGDDGVAGLVLGQGSAEGEAFLAFQAYAKALNRRGVILAVASKNDEANALEAFETHPEMLLARADIAAFQANWDDKAQNLRRIASQVGIGLDSLVFVDDNPFERELVRTELPMVAVPELPEDPAGYARRLADAGYFEALHVTADDRARSRQYAANSARAEAAAQAADLPAYLSGLAMRLTWKPFDRAGLPRIVQLINKTNQFNLTTIRLTEDETLALMAEEGAVCLQFRLTDRFGDNGMIGVTLARKAAPDDWENALWLMSCRVLGRQVEEAMLAVTVSEAQRVGARRLIGVYRPTPKNGMVAELYPRLGFAPCDRAADGTARYALDLEAYAPASTFIAVEAG